MSFKAFLIATFSLGQIVPISTQKYNQTPDYLRIFTAFTVISAQTIAL